jgi:nucleoside-diphosphate-sugar epimerase
MKLALIGATGFIGSDILADLLKHDQEVTRKPYLPAYGDGGGGLLGLLLGSPRDEDGNLVMLGTGQQDSTTAHVADIADFFRRVLENNSARGRYVLGNAQNSTVAELTQGAAVAVGAPGAVTESDEEAKACVRDHFAEVLLHDQGTLAAKACDRLGWAPTHPGLIAELRHGSYHPVASG